jgi:hypothetical protein
MYNIHILTRARNKMNKALELSRIDDNILRTNTAYKQCDAQFISDGVMTFIFEDNSYLKVDHNSYFILATGSKYN